MSNKNSDYYFLKGGGEMGELIRAKDWSKTALGDPANWPQSLRTMVAVMLDNPFGMYIAWGSEYTQLYNDGYRPILGASKHPHALGISTRETFSEIWNIIESMFDGVMKGKAVGFPDLMLPLNRNGFVEECYFDFAYSPIRKDNGEVGGVLVTVIETTEKKRATEALKESNARFINNIMQAPVAMCIFRGAHHVVEIANEQMLGIWGKHADEVMHRPIFEGLPEAKDQGLEPLLNSVFTTGEKFVANERPVDLPRNGKVETTYINFVYEALKEPDGTISGIVAIATEVTSQVISRSRIEESEQKVRALVENAPFPIAVYVGKEMIVELANQSIIDIWGKGNDVTGRSFKEVLPELDDQSVFEQIQEVLETGVSFHTKNTPLDLIIDGKPYTYYFNYSFTPLYDISGNIYGVMNTGVDLTELNLANKRIEKSDQRFRNTMKQAPVGITILRGPEYIVEMANNAYLELVDKTEAEFVGNPLFATLPEVKESVHFLLDGVLDTGVPYHGNEVPIPLNRYGKQEVFYFDFLYHPLKEEDGEISGVIATVTEVTEKVEARKKIEEAEEKTRLAINSAELGVYEIIYSTDEMITDPRFKEIWGVDKSVTRNEYAAFIHPDDILQRKQAHEKAIISGHLDYRARVIWKDKSIHWVRVTGKVIYDSEANPLKLIGITQDITDAVNAREKIEESKEKLNMVIDASELGTYELNLLTDEVIYSDKYLEIFGFIKGTVPTHNELISRLHPDEMQLRNKAFNDALVSGTLFYQAKLIWNDESIHWVDVKGKVFYNEEKKPVKLIGTVGDITEEKFQQQELTASESKLRTLSNTLEKQVLTRTRELEQKNIDLEKMNKELESFAYISSHDLQEPLRKIQTFASFIKHTEENNLSGAGKDMFNRMQDAAKRMQILIQDLLAYSRTNTTELTFETTDLNEIIAEVKEDLKEELAEKHATIEADQLCDAYIIPFQFRQLVYNLIGNSLKFSNPEKPPQIQIKSEIANGLRFKNEKLSPQKKYCHISFSDNGVGFEQQYSEKIFEVFQRLHGRNEYAGTGIGLSIVKKIVDNHHGIITANGELNKGATFDIYIPAS